MGARLFFAVGLLGAVSCGGPATGVASRSSTTSPAESPTGHPSLTPADIAARAMPSVVTLRAGRGIGTGFVVRPDGWIATNLHVIVSSGHVTVKMVDAREFEVVEVLSANPEHDLALVRIDAQGLASLPLGNSDAMRPGDPVVAIGNPLGLEDTVSNGLVSAVRKIREGSEVLQISAPIAQGSSGGPIFNDRGEVIGVATAIARGGQNLNFGVPVRYLVPMMQSPSPVAFSAFAQETARQRERSAQGSDTGFAHHPVSVLDGCSPAARGLIARMISDAVEVGVPLFNSGRAEACYHVYDGAASDLERKLPPSCPGPSAALAGAQTRAASSAGVSTQAWVMRHEFDALLEVIGRAAQGAP